MGNYDYDYTNPQFQAEIPVMLGPLDWTTATANTTLWGQQPLYWRAPWDCEIVDISFATHTAFTSTYISSTTVGPYVLASKVASGTATAFATIYIGSVGYATVGMGWSGETYCATSFTGTTLASGNVLKVIQSAVDASGKSYVQVRVRRKADI